jgi:hypothetical protein
LPLTPYTLERPRTSRQAEFISAPSRSLTSGGIRP